MKNLALWMIFVCATSACGGDGDSPRDADTDVTDVSDEPEDARDTAITDAEIDATAPEVGVTDLPWLRVRDRRMVDEWGREWLLRGMNARIEGLFDVTFDDGRVALEPIPAFDASDAAAIAAYGYDFLRMPINWSGLEPTEGEFDEAYLARIDEVIALCRDAGVYVLVDFHQDAWSKEIGEDGAPLWAILPPPEELLEGPLDDLEDRRTSPQVFAAYESFFTNVDGLQDRFMPAFRLIVSRYADEAAVVGFEPMNEPVVFPFDGTERTLHAFYDRIRDELRAIDTEHALWLEPDSKRNFLLTSARRAEPFGDDNVVYTPHLYPGLAGLDFQTEAGWVANLESTFVDLDEEAASWDAAVVIGEWGIHPEDARAPAYIRAIHTLTEGRVYGHAFWLWKEDSQGSWGFFDTDGAGTWTPREPAIRELTRPYALAVPGRFDAHSFDVETATLEVTFSATGDELAPPLLYLPPAWYPNGADVAVDGGTVEVELDPTTHRALVPWTPAAGTAVIRVTPR